MGAVRPKHRTGEANRAGQASETLGPRNAGVSSSNPFLWPFLAAAVASHASAAFFQGIADTFARNDGGEAELPEPQWTTPSDVVLELSTMRLRDFSAQPDGQPALVCAPYALHGANIADFAPGHSVVEALRSAGLARVFVTDWRSATPEMRYLSIDSYLADLNVAIDGIGAPVDIIGLCQGGWMALVYAARFPAKVRRLILVGAPVDTRASDSGFSRSVANVPFATFENLIDLGGGRVLGRHMLDLWAPALGADEVDRVLQVAPKLAAGRLRELERRFDSWYAVTLDLPGTFYLQTVQWLFRENRIAEGRFVALGRPISLGDIRIPMFLLAARDDQIVAPGQLFATARLVGTPRTSIEMVTEPCGHLSLFLGARTLDGTWRRIARWLKRDTVFAQAS
jgi:poly(3-hydroxyalkanoate) synthetase